MQTIELEYGRCPVTGERGLIPCDAAVAEDYFAMASGMLAAHDVCEHADVRDIGGIADELLALGAAWYVRGQRTIDTRDLASDVARMATDDYGAKGFELDVPELAPCDADADLDEIVRAARVRIRDELRARWRGAGMTNAEKAEELARVREYLRGARRFLRAGYARAETVYGGRGAAFDQFAAVEHAVTRELKHMFDGQRWTLTWGDGRALLVEYYEPSDDDESDDERPGFTRADGCSGGNHRCELCGQAWTDHLAPNSRCPDA